MIPFDAKAKAKKIDDEVEYGWDLVPAIEKALLEAYQAGQKAAYKDAAKICEHSELTPGALEDFIKLFESKAKYCGEK